MPEIEKTVDVSWLERRVDRLDRTVRILIDLLVANKTLDEKTAKVFQEAAQTMNKEDLLKWYEDKLKKR